jgi:hypothetical protein
MRLLQGAAAAGARAAGGRTRSTSRRGNLGQWGILRPVGDGNK